MKYVQPYGIADPNGSYINGNPATGVQGSIPPAMVFENPEREICNLISDSGQTPADADLRQLGKGVQRHSMNYAVDVGTTNAYAVTLAPVPDGYNGGFLVIMKVANTNSGASTLNVNSKGPKNIVHPNGASLRQDTLIAGMLVMLAYDGTNFQIIGAATEKLFAPRDYYVNINTGSDTNSGLTAGSPFQHIQRAIVVSAQLNLNGFDITIHVADGTYPENVFPTSINGQGNIYIIGNVTTPANVLVQPATLEAIHVITSTAWFLAGLKLRGSAGPAGSGYGLRVGAGGGANITRIDFGGCQDAHISVEEGGFLSINGNNPASMGGNSGFVNATGNAPVHMKLNTCGLLVLNQPILNIPGAISVGDWYAGTNCAIAFGNYASITNVGNVTGRQYNVKLNAVNNIGAPTLPGGTAGVTSLGGQVG